MNTPQKILAYMVACLVLIAIFMIGSLGAKAQTQGEFVMLPERTFNDLVTGEPT